MSHQRPIFQSGLFGKANQIVLNNLLEVADTVQQYQAGLINSQGGILEDRQVVRSFLARLNSATSLGALTYRWTYSGVPWVFGTNQGEAVNDSSDQFTGAINLRELFNVLNPVDGMDPTAPPVSVGPVGSTYTGSNTWSITNLQAVVVMYVTVDKFGNVVRYFDRPNPVRCGEESFIPPGGGE